MQKTFVKVSLGCVEEVEVVRAVKREPEIVSVTIEHGNPARELASVDTAPEKDIPETGVDFRMREAGSRDCAEHLVQLAGLAAVLDRIAEAAEPRVRFCSVSHVPGRTARLAESLDDIHLTTVSSKCLMTDDLPRIGRTRLPETVASLLEDKILQGDWHPGRRLPSEPDLGQQLGVSRSVVRDAMKTLATRGLVEVRQGVGTVVAQPTSDAYADAILVLLRRSQLTVGQVLEARELIETELAGFAAARRTDDDCRRMRDCFENYRHAVEVMDWELAQQTHTAFHLSILSAVHAPALEILLFPMQTIILAAPLPPILGDKALWEVPLHEKILSAIERGDVGAAREAVIEHFAFRQSPLYADALDQLCRYVSGDDLTGPKGGPRPEPLDGQ
jgi:GntR family transcriptional regulator, transcriptional repressor for pyruvate dehydrogenase complex